MSKHISASLLVIGVWLAFAIFIFAPVVVSENATIFIVFGTLAIIFSAALYVAVLQGDR